MAAELEAGTSQLQSHIAKPPSAHSAPHGALLPSALAFGGRRIYRAVTIRSAGAPPSQLFAAPEKKTGNAATVKLTLIICQSYISNESGSTNDESHAISDQIVESRTLICLLIGIQTNIIYSNDGTLFEVDI